VAPALRTLLFGGEALSTRGAGQIEILRIPSGVDVFDFDIVRASAAQEVRRAHAATVEALGRQVTDVPADFRQRLRDAAGILRAALRQLQDAAAGEQRIRAYLAVPEDHVAGGLVPEAGAGVNSLTMRFGFGFEDSADDGMLLPLRYRGEDTRLVVRRAWDRREPWFETLATPTANFDEPHDRRRRLLLPRELAWVFCIPVSLPAIAAHPVTLAGSEKAATDYAAGRNVAPLRVFALVVFDGSAPLGGDPASLKAILDLTAEAIIPIIRGEAKALAGANCDV
jgi:hypothetical protein